MEGKRRKVTKKVAALPSSVNGKDNLDEGTKLAMRNPVILEAIFKQCGIPTLENCRLVSKQWFDLSLKHWRPRVVLHLKSTKGKLLLCYQKFFGNPHKAWAPRFSTDMMKLKIHPYRKLCILGGFSCKMDGEYLVTMFAPHLYELSLTSLPYNIMRDAYCRQLIYKLTPNLKKLYIFGPIDYITEDVDVEIHCLKEQNNFKVLEVCNPGNYSSLPSEGFLSTFSKLEVIVSPIMFFVDDEMGEEDDMSFSRFLKIVKKVKSRNPENLPIHHLDMASSLLTEPLVTLFEEASLPLKTLKIQIGIETPEILHRLLHLYKDTLESVVLNIRDFRDADTKRQHPFWLNSFSQRMESLKSLEFLGTVRIDRSLSFLQYTPNLEKLSIQEESGVTRKEWSGDKLNNLKRSPYAEYTNLELAEEVNM